MDIAVLEKINMTDSQRARLEALGNVDWHESSTEEQCRERIKAKDVVVLDWIDPSSFILAMKAPSLLALMSTGYDWIKHREEARQKDILISNVPGYAAEAVAEHLIGLALAVVRKTVVGDRAIRAGRSDKGYLQGVELKGRIMGIIGLGHIGKRVAEIAKCFGMSIITYNRRPKKFPYIEDVPLETLLSSSDVVCISCPLNDSSRGMLDKKRLSLLKPGSIVVGATWHVLSVKDLVPLLKKGTVFGAGFDVAIEGSKLDLPEELLAIENVIVTPHIAYNTVEAKTRQVDICISNIEAFASKTPTNIIN
jgi:phosphoglycerate dehydrogenase-like enzyme